MADPKAEASSGAEPVGETSAAEAATTTTTTAAESTPAVEAPTTSVEPPTVTHWTNPGNDGDTEDGDDFDDGDSAFVDDNNSSTASISASILEYRTIHGRTYHAQKGEAEYWGPNDSRQNEALDITHQVCTMVLDDKLYLAPISPGGKILDVGTGTGLWAIDFADQHPEAEVIGVDISPTQPTWVPPNLKFEVDDVTQPWTYAEDTFDFVHIRHLFGSIADWDKLYEQAFRATKPGGWVESLELSVVINSDDGSVKPGMALHDWGPLFQEAGKIMGKSMSVIEEGLVENAIRKAGFVDIERKKYKVPFTGFAKDETMRKIGVYNHFATEEGLEGWAIYILTQIMGWSTEQVQLLLMKFRKELRLKRVHPWNWYEVIYARKPETA